MQYFSIYTLQAMHVRFAETGLKRLIILRPTSLMRLFTFHWIMCTRPVPRHGSQERQAVMTAKMMLVLACAHDLMDVSGASPSC